MEELLIAEVMSGDLDSLNVLLDWYEDQGSDAWRLNNRLMDFVFPHWSRNMADHDAHVSAMYFHIWTISTKRGYDFIPF